MSAQTEGDTNPSRAYVQQLPEAEQLRYYRARFLTVEDLLQRVDRELAMGGFPDSSTTAASRVKQMRERMYEAEAVAAAIRKDNNAN